MPEFLTELTKFLLGVEAIRRFEIDAHISTDNGFIYVGNYELIHNQMSKSELTSMELWGWIKSGESWAFYIDG
ncbi:hypothetical protein [Nostoc sp. NMS7]|uniref:hypothetical protein n=1 Tax=Nostoc sp. NMS7 TaxID=2815391 RepID=UPI0025D38E03|nr:hypothetical protein [Nostoc sp. NMS7]